LLTLLGAGLLALFVGVLYVRPAPMPVLTALVLTCAFSPFAAVMGGCLLVATHARHKP
jgi:hypothetical protein